MATQVASSTADAANVTDAGALQTALATLLSGVSELLQPQREFWLALAATIDDLSLTEQAANYGIPAAVARICQLPGPGELLEPPLATSEISPEGEAVGAASTLADEESGERTSFVLAGYLGETELALRLELTLGAEQTEVTLRSGGWLLCGLAEGELEVDGEPIELGDPEVSEPELSINVWPEDFEETATEPTAVEVTFRLRLDNAVLLAALEAEVITIWLAETAIDLYPEDSAQYESLVVALGGEVLREDAPRPDAAVTQSAEADEADADDAEANEPEADDPEMLIIEPETALASEE